MPNFYGAGNGPCYQCPNRTLSCHAKCKQYNTWKNEVGTKKNQFEKHINPPMCRYFKKKGSCKTALMSKHRYR